MSGFLSNLRHLKCLFLSPQNLHYKKKKLKKKLKMDIKILGLHNFNPTLLITSDIPLLFIPAGHLVTLIISIPQHSTLSKIFPQYG